MSGFQEVENMKKLLICCLFGNTANSPHIQYKLDEIKETVGNTRSIAIIESLPYASLDASKVLNFVKEQMPELAA